MNTGLDTPHVFPVRVLYFVSRPTWRVALCSAHKGASLSRNHSARRQGKLSHEMERLRIAMNARSMDVFSIGQAQIFLKLGPLRLLASHILPTTLRASRIRFPARADEARYSGRWPRCSRSRIGWRSSASGNTRSGLPRTTSAFPSCLISRIKTSKKLGFARSSTPVAARDHHSTRRQPRLLRSLSDNTPIAAPPSHHAETTGERRHVTVMFSDLVGSTALSARMDPEDLREVISAYQKCVAETVQRFGGFVAKYMGDGVLVYFGYPQAHEDDAERAVRAGLELIRAVGGLKSSSTANPRGHCDWVGRSRRSDRIG